MNSVLLKVGWRLRGRKKKSAVFICNDALYYDQIFPLVTGQRISITAEQALNIPGRTRRVQQVHRLVISPIAPTVWEDLVKYFRKQMVGFILDVS